MFVSCAGSEAEPSTCLISPEEQLGSPPTSDCWCKRRAPPCDRTDAGAGPSLGVAAFEHAQPARSALISCACAASLAS